VATRPPRKLEAAEIETALAACPGWRLDEGKLHRHFEFADFERAFAFMTEVAREAEALDHHPEWSNVYNRVDVYLTTHDAKGLSELDFRLAARMNALAG
jgi:4a-hydroxytetrahydrobiopterin dehydratase